MFRSKSGWLALSLLAVVLIAGCSNSEEPAAAAEPAAPAAAAEAQIPEVSPETAAAAAPIRMAADMLDGTEDKVIGKCASCALTMQGSEEFASNVEGYELHFCSKDCKDHFEANQTETLMALNVTGE